MQLLFLGLAAVPAIVDLTVSMAPGATVIVGTTGSSPYALALAAVDASAALRMTRPLSALALDVSGHFGQPFVVAGVANPPRDVSARSRGRINIATSPRTNIVFLADGFVSSRIGLRATDELAVRDPFSVSRILDGWSIQNSLSGRMTPRSNLRVDFRYSQMGAVWADLPTAVGIDSHAVLATATASFQVSRRVSAGPVTRVGWTHFNHALLDRDFHRGPAEVTTLSVLGFGRYELTRATRASLVAGVTIASAPPGAQDVRTIAYPDVRLEMRTLGRHFSAMGAIAFGYQSLGPRIGFGMDYSGLIDAWIRPFRGVLRRDVLIHCVARSRWAQALLPTGQGNVTTTAFASGAAISAPVHLGWQINAGVDVEFVSMHVDPLPSLGDPPTAFRTLLTLGLSASASTDRGQLLPRDPLAPLEDERRALPIRTIRRKGMGAPVDVLDGWNVEDDD